MGLRARSLPIPGRGPAHPPGAVVAVDLHLAPLDASLRALAWANAARLAVVLDDPGRATVFPL